MTKHAMIWLLIFTGCHVSQAQNSKRELFITAEFDLLASAYVRALPKFQQVLASDTSNANFNYRVGYCYLNIPDEKLKAIPYLEKATRNTSIDYKEGVFKEDRAPIEVYLLLGNLYKANHEMEKAKEAYLKYLQMVNQKDQDKVDYANRQIQSLATAETMKQKQIDYVAYNLGGNINDDNNNFCPAISGDMQVLAFTSTTADGHKLMFVSQKDENGEWDKPRNITQMVGSAGDCHTSDLNHDGTQLLIIKQDQFDSDIYISAFERNRWSKMKKMSKLINTKYWETHASFSPDGKTIYFTSDYKKGFGGLDIYKSEADDNGWWQMPENLGETINSPYDEESPHMANDSILFFSSQGHDNMGGFDVFYSVKSKTGEWGEPVNVGYPVNTAGDNTFFVPLNNMHFALYPAAEEDGFGGLDIYEYEIFSESHPRWTELMGTVQNDGPMPLSYAMLQIEIKDKTTGAILATPKANDIGEYKTALQPGQYEIHFSGEGYENKMESIDIPKGYKQKAFYHTTALLGAPIALMAHENISTAGENRPSIEIIARQDVDQPALPETLLDENPPLTIIDTANIAGTAPGDGENQLQSTSQYYSIQVCALKTYKPPETMPGIAGLKVVECRDGLKRYFYGLFEGPSLAQESLQLVKENGYPGAFIVDMDKLSAIEGSIPTILMANEAANIPDRNVYTIQIMALQRYRKINYIKNLQGTQGMESLKISAGSDGYFRYTVGTFYDKDKALDNLREIREKVTPKAFVREISTLER
jgi:hypothetical protein